MNCLIVEDDNLSAASLKKCIEREGSCNIQAVFPSATQALDYLKTNSCDLIFLDILLGTMNGLDFIQQLTTVPHIIIVSSKSEFAAEAFNFDVADYIVKPVTYERYLQALIKIKKISANYSVFERDYFYIKQQNRFLQLHYRDVLFVEALSDYITIHTHQKRYTILSTMKAIEKELPKKDFMRVHRSYIVRLDKIREIEENTISVEGKVIPVSRYSKDDFLKMLKFI